MVRIHTQGISDDYESATGDFDSLDRGDVTSAQLKEILDKVSKLSAPEGDDVCEPNINVNVEGEGNLNFFGGSGVINCLESKQELMSPLEAHQIILGEVTVSEFDARHGYIPKRNNLKFVVMFVVCLLIVGLTGFLQFL